MTISRSIIFILISILTGFNHRILAMNIGSFHTNGILNQVTKDFFATLGQNFETLDQANIFCQKHFLRTGERWDMQEETPLLKKCKENVKNLIAYFQSLGLVDATYPSQKQFKYVLCMGGLKKGIELRLNCISNLQNNGYSFDTIVLLSSARPLIAREKKDIADEITTEAAMMKSLYDNHPTIKKSNMILIDAPMVVLPNGTVRRPITDDTLELFQREVSDGGTCLVVSNNPYLFRQAKVAQRILDQKKFPVYGAGDAFDTQKTDIFILMDELARAIYEENKSVK